MRSPPIHLLLLALLLAFPFGNRLGAQTTTSGGLTGVVTDQSNAVVPDANVEIEDNAKGTSQSTKTDRGGVYRFSFLAPSRYTLTVEHEGFRRESRTVNVLLGSSVTLNLTLEIAKTSSEITVTDEEPLIQAGNGDVSMTMNQKQISEVPNAGNDLTYIAQTAPGVVMNTDIQGNGNFSILGMPGTSNLFTLNGMSDNDNGFNLNRRGSLGLLLGQNEIQEATVVTVAYSAPFGGAAGGNINYISKSGSNGFHGNAKYYWNGRVLNANDWFNKAFGYPRPFDIANQWAGSLGGPIKKDKLFFFFNTEGLRFLIPQYFFVTVPSLPFEVATIANVDSKFGASSASDAFYKQIFNLYNGAPGAGSAQSGGFSPSTDPTGCTTFIGPKSSGGHQLGVDLPCAMHFFTSRSQPSQDTLTSGRLDWNASNSDRAFLLLQYDSSYYAFFTDPISSVFDTDFKQPWWQAQLLEAHTFSSSAALQLLVAGSYFAPISRVNDPVQALAAFPTSLGFVPNTFTGLGGADSGNAFGSGRYNTQYQISVDAVKTRGKHKLGLGTSFQHIHWSELPNKNNAIGQLSAQTLDAFYQGGVDPASPKTDFTVLTQSFTSHGTLPIDFLNVGLYVQDEWHLQPNLTLTFTLRAEHYSNPVCRTACFARLKYPFESISHDPVQPYNQVILANQKQELQGIDEVLWSPRFSFAWQPLWISKNAVIRGGIGFFYDPLPGAIADSFSGNAPLYNSFTTFDDNLTPNESTSLFKDASASNSAFVAGLATGQNLAQIRTEIPNFFPPSISAQEKTTHSPQYQRWSLEWQQAIGTGTSVRIGYFGHHGIHELVQNANANAYGFGSLPAELCTSPPVPPCADPRFGNVTNYLTNAISNYNGMAVSFQHRFTLWTQGLFQANYTYSHAFDQVSNGGLLGFTNASLAFPQDPNNLRGNYGPADYDVRHSVNANYVLELPIKSALHAHGPKSLITGWQVSGATFARTGFPYTVIGPVAGKFLEQNSFSLIYSVPAHHLGSVPSCGEGAAAPLSPSPCLPPQVLANGSPNPNALFLQSGCETGFNTGNLGPSGICNGPPVTFAQGKNHFRGPSYFNTDFAIFKNTKLPGWEKAELGIGLQFFNLFNHPSFGFPDFLLSDQMLGQIGYLEQPPTSILGAFSGAAAPRMIQLKAQLQF